jgi:phospholipid/cholesterol/gamma-HCH transport system substrate-binding protein
MENRAHAFAAGLFTVLLTLAGVVAVWWMGQRSADTDYYLLEARGNVTGLNLQAPVRYRGIRAGRVESIDLDDKDPRLILVRISLDGRFPLTAGTTARLGYQGVTGLAYVQLEDTGGDATPLVAAGDALPRIALRPTMFDSLEDRADHILAQLAGALGRLNRLLDEKNVGHVARTLENVAAASEGIREVPRAVAALRAALSDANLKRLGQVLAHLEKASGEAAPLAKEARELVGAMTLLSRRLDQLAAGAGDQLAEATLPRADALMQELAGNARRLSRLLDTLEQTPQALVFGDGEHRPGPGEAGFAAPQP